jgi:hypothetical protein
MPASAIPFLSDDSTGALARVEPTAATGAIGVVVARTGDELGVSALRWGRTTAVVRSWGGRSTAGSVGVRGGVAVATTAITSLGDDGTSAETALEAAAARGAIGVAGADASDELFAVFFTSAGGILESNGLGGNK